MDRRTLQFLEQLVRMGENSLPFKVFKHRYEISTSGTKRYGYIPHLQKIMEKYEISEHLNSVFVEGDTFPDKRVWKNMINDVTLEHENKQFVLDCQERGRERILKIEKSLNYPSFLWLCAKSD